jgi:CxxC-x17-CxxC domain-containing protein
MAYQQNDDGSERQMYDVDEKCSKCGARIDKLPFKPNPDRVDRLMCLECYRASRSPHRDH